MILLGLDFLHQAGIIHAGTLHSIIFDFAETETCSRHIAKQHSPWSGRRQHFLNDRTDGAAESITTQSPR
jgi:hypothetical protein